MPAFLDGDFSSLDSAVDFVRRYIKAQKISKAVRLENFTKERQERNASRANSSNGK